MNKNVPESRRLAKDRGVKAKMKQCYYNAFRVIQHVPEYADADYVEGIAVNKIGLCLEHGWVERQGEIFDPTLPDDDMIYFEGLRFTGQAGLAKALRIPKPSYTREDLPIFYRFGFGGSDSPEFCQAWENAFAYVKKLLKSPDVIAAG